MDNREEMRRLIDVIEKSVNNSSLTQAIDDMRLFLNTASFLANALDTLLKTKEGKSKKKLKLRKTVGQLKPPLLPIPKIQNTPKPQNTKRGMPNAISTAISQADFDRSKPQKPQSAL